MLDRVSADSVMQTFRRFGFTVRQSGDWLIIRFPYPSTRTGMLDLSEGFMYWNDLKYWADAAGIDRERFEDSYEEYQH